MGRTPRLTTYGPKNHFKVAIQVPARTDLHVRLTAGELRVENVQGNKDIESHAGEIDIDVGRPEEYHLVEASIWAGEIHAAPYHCDQGRAIPVIRLEGPGALSAARTTQGG